MSRRRGFTYEDAGVDIDAADALVDRFRELADRSGRPEVLSGIGGFGGLFRPDLSGMTEPVLVSSADGVGTKVRVAFLMGKHDTVGIDLVAMVVNDLLPQAAEPLFLLDYFATGRLEPGVPEAVVKGVAEGCRLAGCVLLGGETAEMPDSYPPGEYDLAGFAVGLVDRPALPDPARVREGDVLLGLASSGIHSNGYSLVRRVLFDHHGLDPHEPVPELDGAVLGDVLLEPTRIYVRSVMAAFRAHDVRGAAHITGGGIPGKLPRVLPPELRARVVRDSWPAPPIFRYLIDKGGLDDEDAWRTFNMGIGMILIVPEAEVDATRRTLEAEGETVFRVGTIETRAAADQPAVEWADG